MTTTQAIEQGHELLPADSGGVLPKLRENDKVTFSDLVLAHHLRQTAIYCAVRAGASHDDRTHARLADAAYRDRRERFEGENGQIVRAYWCTHEVSAVAITQQDVPLPWWRLKRTEKRERYHSATDWATRNCPELKHQLHKVDNLGVRADEILRGTSENIAMQLLLTAASHVLSYVDQEKTPRDPARIRHIVDQSNSEIADIRRYYERAGENSSRLVYAGGMLRGAVLLGVLTSLAGLVLWAAGTFHPHRNFVTTWTILATIAAGGMGASVSVLLRMAKDDFKQDYEVGRKSTRRLAMARPFVGAAFAMMIFLLLKSGLVDIGGINTTTIYFYAAVGFLAGFSERWARVIIGGVTGDDPDDKQPAPQPKDPPKGDAAAPNPSGG